MVRQGHAKSRNGCFECKRRHVKCDEVRPTCNQCVRLELPCAYYRPLPRRSRKLQSLENGPNPEEHATTPQTVASSESSCKPTPDEAPSGKSPVNLVHLELFYHFQTETCKPIGRTNAQVEMYRSTVIPRAVVNPYLMSEILALSALHLSLERPAQADFYCNLALQFQSDALAGYHQILPRLDASNCVDALLFSHALALHVFAETFMLLHDSFDAFLEKLTNCISLLMGINMVISPWWSVIAGSPLGGLLSASHVHPQASEQSNGECDALWELIDQADLSQASIETCRHALRNLQKFFDVERYLGDSSDSINLIFGWLVTTKPEFKELIERRRPEALILLAYYAVILDKRRGAWAVRDAGEKLLASITTYLGKPWQKWLTWPNAVINAESEAEKSEMMNMQTRSNSASFDQSCNSTETDDSPQLVGG